ncbi:MAG: 16S rRNA (adenine(1518)-N(6)/adenine(1519)-N(6))-dimethyltransferase RsmA [Candidatus Staskawiczbacteria bacterium]|jgi:16S rRNA (adenine1518-N6/adenine1519-N6)-dimethyltransferase
MNQNSIKNTLKNIRIHPSKGLGQNFLVDKATLNKIVSAAGIKPSDNILEIGPGTGILTQELAKKAKKVIAIEKDVKMVELLRETLKDFKNVEIVPKDILKIKDEDLFRDYKLVANLPYYITSPVIRKFLEIKNQPKVMILMVQKEVAQRICAKPPRMNLLAVSVQFYGTPEIINYVPKESFWPKPKVDSAIIKIVPKKSLESLKPELFFKIVKAGFSHPRKQILGNFKNILKIGGENLLAWLKANSVSPDRRAESLSVGDWINLAETFD